METGQWVQNQLSGPGCLRQQAVVVTPQDESSSSAVSGLSVLLCDAQHSQFEGAFDHHSHVGATVRESALGAGLLPPPLDWTAGLHRSHEFSATIDAGHRLAVRGDLRSAQTAGSGDPRRARRPAANEVEH